MGIEVVNEIAKLKAAAASGGGGSGSQYGGTSVTPISKAQFFVSSLTNTSFNTHAGSSSYQRGFNHGGGQFSVAAIPFYIGTNQTQFYVQPFTVNQTTGVITAGTGSAVWSNGSSSLQSTMNWGSAGSVAFNFGQHGAPGYSTNTGIATAWTVSGNTVTGGYYTDGTSSWPANGNQDGAVCINAGTYYWAPSNNNNGTPSNLVFSYTAGSTSVSRTRNNALTSFDTSTNYIMPIVRQFGNLAATNGTIHAYRRNGARWSLAVLNSTFGIVNTYYISDLGIAHGSSFASNNGIGLELSNGRQLFYSRNFGVILRDGSTLTNVSSTADTIPNTNARERHFTAVAPDTWICMSEGSPREAVKFSINPNTYKITILGSFMVSALTGNEYTSNTGVNNGGLHITGSTNQFVVAISQASNGPNATVMVGRHNL